jgi:hypothetical protein
VESEGILIRFWYPVSGLDKPQVQKKPNLNSSTVNMFKLHRYIILQLVRCKKVDSDLILGLTLMQK